VGTGDSPEIREMPRKIGPGSMLHLGVSEKLETQRNRNLKANLAGFAYLCFVSFE